MNKAGNKMKLKLVISLTGILMLYGFTMKPSTDTTTGKEDNRSWVLGPFVVLKVLIS